MRRVAEHLHGSGQRLRGRVAVGPDAAEVVASDQHRPGGRARVHVGAVGGPRPHGQRLEGQRAPLARPEQFEGWVLFFSSNKIEIFE